MTEKPGRQRVIDALRAYRDADNAMSERARSMSSMTDNEMRIVQFLLTEAKQHHSVTPTGLAKHLGVTSASMTALLDRLERAGAIERVRHPSDRRSLLITATPLAERTVGAPIVALREATEKIADELSESDHEAVVSFLDKLTSAVNSAGRAAG